MLTKQQYEMLGRLSLAFNRLDFLVGAWLETLLGIPEGKAAEAIATQGSFSSKIARFRTFLEAIAKDYHALESDIQAVVNVLNNAEKLGENRNAYMHALAYKDAETKEVRLWIKREAGKNKKKKWVAEPFKAGDVKILIEQAKDAVRDLRETSGKLLRALDEKRTRALSQSLPPPALRGRQAGTRSHFSLTDSSAR